MKNIDLSKYNSTEELYKEHSKKFKIRWILFTVFLAIVAILLFATLIEYIVRKENYLNNYSIILSEENKSKAFSEIEKAANAIHSKELALLSVSSVISIIVIVWHLVLLFQAIKNKDFGVYSQWLSSIYSILIFFVIINLFLGFGNLFKIEVWNVRKILNLVYTFVLPIGYFIFYWPCGKIIRMFKYVKIQSQMPNMEVSPLDFLSKMSGNQDSNVPNNMNQTFVNQQIENQQKNIINYREQLNTLDDEKLVLMADKLNIYGAKDLGREKLIEKIILIFETNSSKESKVNDEISIDNEDKLNNNEQPESDD